MMNPPLPKILLADDADVGRAILRSLLRKEFDVVEARNGLEAIRILSSEPGGFAAAVVDVMMPVMDGFHVLEFLRGRGVAASFPVIVLTAISDVDAKVRLYEAGATEVMEKPYDEKIIVAKIRALSAFRSVCVTTGESRADEAEARDAFAESVLDALPGAVFAAEPGSLRITWCNALFHEIPGVPAEPVGRDLRDCLPAARPQVTEVWEELVMRRRRAARHFRVPGDTRFWRLSLNALLDEAGDVSDIVGTLFDASPYFHAAPALAEAFSAKEGNHP